jgi:hypothetical protein
MTDRARTIRGVVDVLGALSGEVVVRIQVEPSRLAELATGIQVRLNFKELCEATAPARV